MRIAFDMQGAQTESRYRGIGRYTTSLVRAILDTASNSEIYLILNCLFPETIAPIKELFSGKIPPENFILFNAPGPVRASNPGNNLRRGVSELIFEKLVADLDVDVLHVCSLFEGYVDDAITPIMRHDRKYIISTIIYDIIPFLNPKEYLEGDKIYSDFYLQKIKFIKNVDILFSISESSRNEGIEHLNIDEGRIVNIRGATSDVFYREDFIDANFLSSIGVEDKYILYTGGADWRKNIERLIGAYSKLSSSIRGQYKVVLAGRMPDGDVARLRHLAKTLRVPAGDVIFTGFISDEVLRQLYSNCSLFVFPSWHEGLGLPILEAMRCGAPVIAANTSSMPEIVGLDEALFDPFDEKSIADKIQSALLDPVFTQKLKYNAERQSKKFTWDESANTAIQSLTSIIRNGKLEDCSTYEQVSQQRSKNYRCFVEDVAKLLREESQQAKMMAASVADAVAKNDNEVDRILRQRFGLPKAIEWKIEGPFDSSYSLALLNRETARALSALSHNVSLYSTEGPGDFPPDEIFLKKNPDLQSFHDKGLMKNNLQVDVVSRNLYPPRVSDMHAKLNLLHHYAWEESGFPSSWVDDFNAYLQGITCLSKHVEKILIDNGVSIPLSTSGCGVDHWDRVAADNSYKIQGKKFRFLHVSSCFPRKGADVLIKAFGKAFTARDDVSLIIKTFPNPHNNVEGILETERRGNENFPDVQIIMEDISEGQLKSLYEQCDVLVAPSFAEGFGLPLAEAMLAGLPVITTNWGGQLDFCSEETAWLVDFSFEPAETHFDVFNSVWAVPDVDALASVIQEVFRTPAGERRSRAARGRKLLLDEFKWEHVAGRLTSAARQWSKGSLQPEPKIGWVSTWDTRCGIAEYSKHLINNIDAEVKIFARTNFREKENYNNSVDFCWSENSFEKLSALYGSVVRSGIDIVIIQFNYGFFDLDRLNWFINKNVEDGRHVVIFLHATVDPAHAPERKLEKLVTSLRRCKRVLVHTHNDMNRLKALGVVDNVALFPHGVIDHVSTAAIGEESAFKIATYGFFLPHKGLLEAIEAVAIVRDRGVEVSLNMVNAEHPAPISKEMINKAKEKIQDLGLSHAVRMTNDFLDDIDCLKKLEEADLIIFPYQSTGESSSAAVRYGLAAGRPVAATPLPIFDDVQQAVFKFPGYTPRDIAEGIMDIRAKLRSNDAQAENTLLYAEHWRQEHRYSRVARRLHNMLIALSR
ncbi:glycosyltransferase [Phyllobacterium salinisoli]|uniref:Glycosyltransferase n=1 Tax=Phyllobacterium salinisoli TaxID=1899321 RepID=A0A368K1Q7_9HYPH|nr:glycosyltransferase [Phyllobacterium salinisoli]RCS23328.1 glycosyltransferase [Phyllobacterium salinisoli]